MLQEKTNLIEIVGLLSEVNIEKKTKDGKDYLTGKVTIKTQDKIEGELKDLEITIPVYAGKLTNAGKDNPAYKSLIGVRDGMISIAACGSEEGATMVRVYTDKGGLRENIWKAPDNRVVCTVRPNVSFFNAVKKDTPMVARFETLIFILSIDEEIDKEGVQTGRLKIAGAVPGWNGSINKIDFVVGNPKAVEHIGSLWEKGQTALVAGIINHTTVQEKYTEDFGFGDPIVKTRTRSKKEFLITAGRGEHDGLPEENIFDATEIFNALSERKKYIDGLQEEVQAAAPKKPDMSSLGF